MAPGGTDTMRITKIERQKKRPGRKNVYADGQFVAGVSDETLLRLALRTGDEIGPDILATLQRTEQLFQAKAIAHRYLSSRPRTEREIRDKLREKEFPDDDIRRTIDEMRSSGLLDDRHFAEMYIRDALALKPVGKLVLRRKLLLLGVDRLIVDDALQEAFTGVDMETIVLQSAQQFLKRTAASGRKPDPQKLRIRLTNFLLRRGYPWDVAGPVVRSLLGARDWDDRHE